MRIDLAQMFVFFILKIKHESNVLLVILQGSFLDLPLLGRCDFHQ